MSDKPRLIDHPELIAASIKSVAFYAEHVLGVELTHYQLAILEALESHREVGVRSGHGTGKTRLSAVAASRWFDTRQNSICVVTSRVHPQAMRVIREMQYIRRNARYELPGRSMDEKLVGGEKHFVEPRVAKDADSFSGYHSDYVLLIYEEAGGLEAAIREAARGAVSGTEDRELFIGNPTQDAGPFADLWRRGETEDRRLFTISSKQTPNYIKGREVVKGLATKKYVQSVLDGCNGNKDDDQYRVRVLGLPPKGAGDGVFSLLALDRAKQRGEELATLAFDGLKWQALLSERKLGAIRDRIDEYLEEQAWRAGLDVGGGGDLSAQVGFRGQALRVLEEWSYPEGPKTARRVIGWMARHPGCGLAVDITFDPSVGNLIRESFPAQVRRVNFGSKPALGKLHVNDATGERRAWYADRRTELWFEAAGWTLQEAVFTPDVVAHPLFAKLERDLLAPKADVDPNGSRRLEQKKVTKKRLRRSPDLGDAYVLAVSETMGGRSVPIATGATEFEDEDGPSSSLRSTLVRRWSHRYGRFRHVPRHLVRPSG